MRIFVTGGAGFIGSHVVDRLLYDGHTVLVVDDLSTESRSNLPNSSNVEFLEMDMGHPAFNDAATEFHPNAIGHTAAQPGGAGVVAIFAARLNAGRSVEIFGDGEQTRDFVYVRDVAAAHALAVRTSQSFTVNISCGRPVSANELFRIMAAETGYERRPFYQPELRGDHRDSVLAKTALENCWVGNHRLHYLKACARRWTGYGIPTSTSLCRFDFRSWKRTSSNDCHVKNPIARSPTRTVQARTTRRSE